MNLHHFFIFSFFLFSTYSLQSQAPPIKWGNVKQEHLQMQEYAPDPSASVVILADYGEVRVDLDNNTFGGNFDASRWVIVYKRHRRIKILNKAGFDWADIRIPYYHENNMERVRYLKAQTIYLDEKGKERKEKLDIKQVMDEDIDERWHQKKFSMPAVGEGVIIEYSYEIYSQFFTEFRNWNFQHDVPVLWSEYRANIPNFFDYQKYYQSQLPLSVDKSKPYSQNVYVEVNARTDVTSVGAPRVGGGKQTIPIAGTAFRWVAENVPALVAEPYMTTLKDFRAAMIFQLQEIRFPNSSVRSVMTDWQQVSDFMLQSIYFGAHLVHHFNGDVRRKAKELTKDQTDDLEKMKTIYDFVRTTIEWDGVYRLETYSEETLNKTLKNRQGANVTINLMLTLMLETAGLKARPALISTRNHGKYRLEFPVRRQFNHVLVHVELGDDTYWLDATEKYRPYNMLAANDLNEQALLLQDERAKWLPIENIHSFKHVVNSKLTLSEEGEIQGVLQSADYGYSALKRRSFLKQKGEKAFLAEEFAGFTDGLNLKSHAFENLNELEKPLKAKYHIQTDQFSTVEDGTIYLQPMMMEAIEVNPFRLESRSYPVDYGHPHEFMFIFNLQLPEDYKVTFLPEPAKIVLADEGAIFSYLPSNQGNTVQIVHKLKIQQTAFSPEEYDSIKDFYNLIVAKHAEQVVIEKEKEK